MELSLLSGLKMQIHSENVRSAAFVGFRSTSSIHLPFGCKSKPTLKPSPLSCCHTEMYFLCFSHSWSTLRSLICKPAFELKQVTWEVSCLRQFIGQSWLLKTLKMEKAGSGCGCTSSFSCSELPIYHNCWRCSPRSTLSRFSAFNLGFISLTHCHWIRKLQPVLVKLPWQRSQSSNKSSSAGCCTAVL